METLYVKRNDTRRRELRVTQGSSGTGRAVSLETANEVRFLMRGDPMVDVPVEILDPSAGLVGWDPEPAAVDTAGEFDAEVKVEWEDGSITTAPEYGHLRVVVISDLGP